MIPFATVACLIIIALCIHSTIREHYRETHGKRIEASLTRAENRDEWRRLKDSLTDTVVGVLIDPLEDN